MNKIKQILACSAAALLFACNSLDIPPMNVMGDPEIFGSKEGVTAYLSQLYSEMPIMQFHSGSLVRNSTMCFSGEMITNESAVMYGGSVDGLTFHNIGQDNWIGPVWNYEKIRRMNYFLATMPDYAGSYAAVDVDTWLAEAHFIRAFYYFEMARRWGGVPLVTEVTNYPEQTAEELSVPRNKEAEVYDFILSELDEAARLFPNDPAARPRGRANRWVALALKARAALHAGSLAVFGPVGYPSGHMYREGLCGVPTERAAEFFNAAYDAAYQVVREGHYDLYKKYWAAGDPEAQEKNYEQLFLDTDNGIEAMFSVYYVAVPKNNAHMFDTNNRPTQVNGADYAGKASPTVELIEQFEYAATGQPVRLDAAKTGTNTAPVLYKNTIDLFEGVEPRLRASVILPGAVFMDEEIDIRYGIVASGRTVADDKSNVKTSGSKDELYEHNGVKTDMYVAGKSGIGYQASTVSGFYVRKFQDPTLSKENVMNHIHGSTTPWMELRYAEVLLTLAEAAVELRELGAADASKLDEAARQINAVRQRAGAFNKNFTGATLTREAVRNERRKELFFENKTYWDIIRWRVAHEEINLKQWSVLFPIYLWESQSYYMKRDTYGDNYRRTFTPMYYYQSISSAVTTRNPKIQGNPSGNEVL
jgi:hypothetical protein